MKIKIFLYMIIILFITNNILSFGQFAEDVNSYVDNTGYFYATPLHRAVSTGNIVTIKKLLQNPKTNIELKTIEGSRACQRGGNTALSLAAESGNKEIVDLLINEAYLKFGTTQKFVDFINSLNDNELTAAEMAQISIDKLRNQKNLNKKIEQRISDLQDIIKKLNFALTISEQLLLKEYFPEDVANIVRSYISKEPRKSGLSIFNKYQYSSAYIYPSKPDISSVAANLARDKISDWGSGLEIKYDSNIKGGTFINAMDIIKKPDFQNWLSLGIVIAYKLGARKFTLGFGWGEPPKRIYYPTPLLNAQNFVYRTKMSLEELINHFKVAQNLQDRLIKNNHRIIIDFRYDRSNEIIDLSIPDDLMKNAKDAGLIVEPDFENMDVVYV